MFTLPDFDELTPDQDDVLAAHLDSSAVVTGPPGTGKTLMAVQRAHLLHRARRPTLLLMFNRLLSSYTGAAVMSLGLDSVTSTYHQWFGRFWRRHYGGRPPGDGAYNHDWAECKRIIMQRQVPPQEKRHVIVDEGQDLPRDFYLVLRLVARSLTVFADENQRITEHQSTIEEIQAATGISTVRRLTRNRRNPRPIAQFANHFYTGLPSGTAELPPPHPTDEPPVLDAHPRVHEAVEYLADYEQSRPDLTMGVLLPRATDVRTFHNRLGRRSRNQAQLYVSKEHRRPDDPQIDMSTPGLKILTWASCKGLEFDAVFLPELQHVPGEPTGDDVRMKLYVVCTRARRSLTLLYTGDGEPAIIGTMPFHLMTDKR
jgi:DNA helicase IV